MAKLDLTVNYRDVRRIAATPAVDYRGGTELSDAIHLVGVEIKAGDTRVQMYLYENMAYDLADQIAEIKERRRKERQPPGRGPQGTTAMSERSARESAWMEEE